MSRPDETPEERVARIIRENELLNNSSSSNGERGAPRFFISDNRTPTEYDRIVRLKSEELNDIVAQTERHYRIQKWLYVAFGTCMIGSMICFLIAGLMN